MNADNLLHWDIQLLVGSALSKGIIAADWHSLRRTLAVSGEKGLKQGYSLRQFGTRVLLTGRLFILSRDSRTVMGRKSELSRAEMVEDGIEQIVTLVDGDTFKPFILGCSHICLIVMA